MQEQLPPGHSLAGQSFPALGGVLHRVKRDSDGRDLLARSAGGEYASEVAVQHLDAELSCRARDECESILRPAERIDGHRQSWLIYEAVAGHPLDTTKAYELDEFWDVAHALTSALAQGHRHGLAHGRLDSNCVWWDPMRRRIGLLGMVPVEKVHIANQLPPTVDTAPELIASYRAKVTLSADVYSLGAILYRLLSGRAAVALAENLAFDAAANPPPGLDPQRVPARLVDLVERMLSKSPSLRPFDGSAVLDELEAIRIGVPSVRPKIDFRVASLVGRTHELQQLVAHARAAETGVSVVVRVAGEPGVGKSHLLAEFIRRVTSESCLLGNGKFEQFHQGRPYGALLAACENALNHALAGDERVFTATKQRLRDADPALLGVLAQDIPELEHLCGKLPEPAPTGPSENQNRFKRAFDELLRKLCAPDAPLILVLDDLQWADRATADLLVELFKSGLPEHLLLALVYRESAARQNTDLSELFRATSETPLVTLRAFELHETKALCQAVAPDCDALGALAANTHLRSQGNALHCVELLKNFVATGELTSVGGRWRYAESRGSLRDVSETVAELIRDRLSLERPQTRQLLAAAACIGHGFSESLLGVATGESPSSFREPLRVAVERGFLATSTRGGEYTFCHDRIQQVALELSDEDARRTVSLRLGRHYREQIAHDRSLLFPCLEHLNQACDALDDDERRQLSFLNLEGAQRARATIAYERAIPLLRLYLQSDELSSEKRFEGTLLLMECLCLSDASDEHRSGTRDTPIPAKQALEECSALATTDAQKLKLLHTRLLFCVHDQDYTGGVDVGLTALRLLGHPLPQRPWLVHVIARVVLLSARMRLLDLDRLAQRPDRATENDLAIFRFLIGLWGPSHWTDPYLNLFVSVRLVEMTLRCGNGKHSSMAYACYAAICHMQQRYETAIRYGRVANVLARDHSPYTRAVVRFLMLTFFGAFEYTPREVVEKYDDALKDAIAHGEIIASHLIDGAVTMLPHLGPEIPQVHEALKRYGREARTMGAKTSLEMIQLVRCWCQLLTEGPNDPKTGAPRSTVLHSPVEHESFAAGRDILRMQIEYLWGHDDEVLRLAQRVRKNQLLKGNPLHKGSYALFVVLASLRSRKRLTPVAREAFKFLKALDRVQGDAAHAPRTFLPSLRLAEGMRAFVARDASACDLLQQAAEGAAEKKQELVRAICLECLAQVHGALGQHVLCVERLRDAAHCFRRFGAIAKAQRMVRECPGIDWTHLQPRIAGEAGIQVEGIMRSASAIVEATSTDELGPTLLRVIATAAGAMRAHLFTYSEGKLFLVACCERDRADVCVTPTSLEDVDPCSLALKPVRRVERSHQVVELPRHRDKFLDDAYLTGTDAPPALLCVPLLYRGDLVAILYLEKGGNAETFSQDDVTLVTLLGKQAAIALTNADNHRLQVEALQSKVNPHFLYNALSVIAELVGRSPEQAEDAVYRLTRLYRYMLSSPANQRVPLEKELALVRDYLELERARFGDRLRVRWDVDSAATSLQVPALLMQPLAENAVNHGVRRNVNGGTVAIGARVEEDSLLLTVTDDGPGWYEGRGGTGFGLKSVRRRLQLVYGTRAELRIVKGNGVAVHLNIPI